MSENIDDKIKLSDFIILYESENSFNSCFDRLCERIHIHYIAVPIY